MDSSLLETYPRASPSEIQTNGVTIACVVFLLVVSFKGAFGTRQKRITTFTVGASFAASCVVTYGFYRIQTDTALLPARYTNYVAASQDDIDKLVGNGTSEKGRIDLPGRDRLLPQSVRNVGGVQVPDIFEWDPMPAVVFVGSMCLFLAYASFYYTDVDPKLKWFSIPGIICLVKLVFELTVSDERQHFGNDLTLRILNKFVTTPPPAPSRVIVQQRTARR